MGRVEFGGMRNKSQTTTIKRDAWGRVLTSPKRRNELLDEYERTGVSPAQFARVKGIKLSTMCTWIKRRQLSQQQQKRVNLCKKVSPVRFIEAVITSPRSLLTVELPGGARVSVESKEQIEGLSQLLITLARKERGVC